MKKVQFLFLCLFLLTAIIPLNNAFADEFIEDETFKPVFSSGEYKESQVPLISAGAAIVMDTKSGRVLYEKNAYTKMSMASTTKIMTAIVALENGSLDDVVIVSKKAADIWGSVIGLREGQKMTLGDMMYGLLLCSGNDAAIAIAEHIGGTVENFLDMMNEKAVRIGARNTQFKSPHGLDMDGHYSTAYDLAVIASYALENPDFSKTVSTKSASVQGMWFSNTNEMLTIYPGADGVKTGYTGKAGRCLVTSATRDGWRIVSVVLQCPSRNIRALSSKKILDYAFNNYKPYVLQKKGQCLVELPLKKGIEKSIEVRTVEEIVIPLKDSEKALLEKRIYLPGYLNAPVNAGVDVGTVQYYVNGEIIADSNLMLWSDVGRKDFWYYLGHIFREWCRVMHEGIF